MVTSTPITRLKLRTELLDDDDMRTEFHDDLDELHFLDDPDANIHWLEFGALADEAIKRLGHVDILVNNAGAAWIDDDQRRQWRQEWSAAFESLRGRLAM